MKKVRLLNFTSGAVQYFVLFNVWESFEAGEGIFNQFQTSAFRQCVSFIIGLLVNSLLDPVNGTFKARLERFYFLQRRFLRFCSTPFLSIPACILFRSILKWIYCLCVGCFHLYSLRKGCNSIFVPMRWVEINFYRTLYQEWEVERIRSKNLSRVSGSGLDVDVVKIIIPLKGWKKI